MRLVCKKRTPGRKTNAAPVNDSDRKRPGSGSWVKKSSRIEGYATSSRDDQYYSNENSYEAEPEVDA
jgi:hypothetical protein